MNPNRFFFLLTMIHKIPLAARASQIGSSSQVTWDGVVLKCLGGVNYRLLGSGLDHHFQALQKPSRSSSPLDM